jgi:hypothetical protein
VFLNCSRLQLLTSHSSQPLYSSSPITNSAINIQLTQVQDILRPTVIRSVRPGVGPPSRAMARFLLLSDICGLHVVGRPPWREGGSASTIRSCSHEHILTVSFETVVLPFRRLLRLAGLRWGHSKPPPHDVEAEAEFTTDSQSASLSWCRTPIWSPWSDFFFCLTITGLLVRGTFSDERMGLQFIAAARPRQHSSSRVWVPREFLRLPQPGGPGPLTYISQELSGQITRTSLGTVFSFRRLLRLAGLRWRYSNTPPHAVDDSHEFQLTYVATDGQSASSSWCRAPFAINDQILSSLSDNYFLSSSCRTPSLTRGRICNLQCNRAQVRVVQDP